MRQTSELDNFFIYKTTCLVNKKIYIGQHLRTGKSWDDYYLGSGKVLLKAIKKYGKENFRREIITICIGQFEADVLEKFYIEKYHSNDPKIGYNLLPGGQGLGRTCYRLPDATGKHWYNNGKIEMLQFECPDGFVQGRLPFSEEQKSKISIHSKEVWQNDEYRQKLSESMKKYYETHDGPNKGKTAWNKGKKVTYSEEWHEAIKNRDKSFYKTSEFREQCSKRIKNLIWITNGIDSKRIFWAEEIPDGWWKGRTAPWVKGEKR